MVVEAGISCVRILLGVIRDLLPIDAEAINDGDSYRVEYVNCSEDLLPHF